MAISKNKYIQVDLGIGYLHTNMGSINPSLKNRNNKWGCPQNSKYMTIGTRLGYNWSPGTIKLAAEYSG
jgi:hypothetical protein